MKAYFIKFGGSLHPASGSDRELLDKIKPGTTVLLTLTRPRNILFHRKFFGLVNYLFDCWEPDESKAAKNVETFRKDLTILAGYFDEVIGIDGAVKVKAKSISFASMYEDEFEKLYSAVIDVGIRHILPRYTEYDLRQIVERGLMEFA